MPNTFKLYHLGLYFKICLVNYLSQFAACQNPKCTNAECYTLTAIHTPATPEYTHDDSYTRHPGIHSRPFFSCNQKKQHMLFIANSFQNLQNKKKGGLHPLKKNYSISFTSSASAMSMYSFRIYRLSPSATGAML